MGNEAIKAAGNEPAKMTSEKLREARKEAELKKMTQAILGQSKEKPGSAAAKDLVFVTEIEREEYLYKLQASSIDGSHQDLIDQLASAKANIRSETQALLKDLDDTTVGGTGENYKKREAAQKKLDAMEASERKKQRDAMEVELRQKAGLSTVATKPNEAPIAASPEKAPGKWTDSGKVVAVSGTSFDKDGEEVTYKKEYNVFTRETKDGNGVDVKIADKGFATTIMGVPATEVDTLLSAYETANKKDADAKYKPLQDGFLGNDVTYASLVEAQVVAAPTVNKGDVQQAEVTRVAEVADLNKEGYILNKENGLVGKNNQDGVFEPFTGKGKFAPTATLTQEGIYQNGQLIEGTHTDTLDPIPKVYKGTWTADAARLFTGTVTIGERVMMYENGQIVADTAAGGAKEEKDPGMSVLPGKAEQEEPEHSESTKTPTVQEIIEWMHQGKYALNYDEKTHRVQVVKGKNKQLVRYFTVGNEENAKFDTAKNPTAKDEIEAWLKRRAKIDEAKAHKVKQHPKARPAAPHVSHVEQADKGKEEVKPLTAKEVESSLKLASGTYLGKFRVQEVKIEDMNHQEVTAYKLDLFYDVMGTGGARYSMVPEKSIVITPWELKQGKIWKGVSFYPVYSDKTENTHMPVWEEKHDIVLSAFGNLEIKRIPSIAEKKNLILDK